MSKIKIQEGVSTIYGIKKDYPDWVALPSTYELFLHYLFYLKIILLIQIRTMPGDQIYGALPNVRGMVGDPFDIMAD